MKTLATIASALIAASVFVVPFSAMAETKAPAGHNHRTADAFPMKADVYKKLVDGKIDRMKGHFEQGLSKRSLTTDQKAEMEKAADEMTKELHQAVEKVTADGVVTRDEAKQIKDLGEQLRGKLRQQLKGKHASAKASKGAKPAKGKGKAKSDQPKAPAKKSDAPSPDKG